MGYFINDELFNAGYEAAFKRFFAAADKSQPVVMAKNVGVMNLPKAVHRLHEHNPQARLVFI